MSKTTIPTGGITDGTIATGDIADAAVTAAKSTANTVYDTWYISSNVSGGATTITSNWVQWGGGGYARSSSVMSQSSGVFTFPSTGIYYVDWQAEFRFDGASRYNEVKIQITTDNSSYNDRAYGYCSINTSGTGIEMARTSTFVDVTNTTNVKLKFGAAPENSSATLQSSTANYLQTRAIFLKLGDT